MQEGVEPLALYVGELVLALALGLMIRLAVALRATTDQWGVRTKIQKQRKGAWLSYEMPDSLIQGVFPYPMLFYFVVAWFPKSMWSIAAVVLNVVSDLVIGAAVFVATMVLMRESSTVASTEIHRYAFLAALLLLTLPALVPVTSRVRACNGRAPGLVVTTVYFCCIAISIEADSPVWLLPAVVAGAAAFLTSFFAMQTVVFFSALLSLFYLHWAPLAPVAAVVGIGFLFPRLGLRDVIIFKVNHFIWYLRNRSRTVVGRRSILRSTFLLFVSLFRDRSRSARLFLRDAPLVIGVYSVLPIWVLVAVVADQGLAPVIGFSPAIKFCLLMVLCSTCAFALTATGPLTVFGQAERYYEYSAPMLCVSCVVLATEYDVMSYHGLLLLVVAQAGVIGLIQLMSSPQLKRRLRKGLDDGPEVKELVEFLERIPGEVRAATLPIKLPILLSAYTGNAPDSRIKYYYRFILNPERKLDGFQYFEDDMATVDLFGGTPQALAAKYNLNTMIVESRMLKNPDNDFACELKKLTPVFSNATYQVFRL